MRLAIGRHAPAIFRISALAGTLTLHLLAVGHLLRSTEASPQARWLRPLVVAIELPVDEVDVEPEATPPPPPAGPAPPADPPRPPLPARRPAAAAPGIDATALTITTAPASDTVVPASPDPIPPEARAAIRLDQQRSAVAAEIARENAPKRRAFSGRSLDAMLPGADSGRLPGLRPRVRGGGRELARKLKSMWMGLPQAAVDRDAVLDPLTERWEEAHHGSDLAACERQYLELDRELRRQMCGEVRPPR